VRIATSWTESLMRSVTVGKAKTAPGNTLDLALTAFMASKSWQTLGTARKNCSVSLQCPAKRGTDELVVESRQSGNAQSSEPWTKGHVFEQKRNSSQCSTFVHFFARRRWQYAVPAFSAGLRQTLMPNRASASNDRSAGESSFRPVISAVPDARQRLTLQPPGI